MELVNIRPLGSLTSRYTRTNMKDSSNMNTQEFVRERVSKYYWKDDINCAETTLKVLSEHFNVGLNEDVFQSCCGLPGAGQCGALCGIVSGTIMFLGISGNRNKFQSKLISEYCKRFTNDFKSKFKSVQCGVLRPEGFHPDNPPHICERLTCDALELSISLLSKFYSIQDYESV